MSRILLLHDYAGDGGGAEILALDLRRAFRARGHDARLLTSDAVAPRQGTEPDYLCRGSLGLARAIRETWNASAARTLRRVLRAFRPDVVQIVMFLTQLSPAILPGLRGVPTVYGASTYRAICPTGLRWRPGEGVCHLRAGPGCRAAGCFGRVGIVPRLAQLGLLGRGRSAIEVTLAPSAAMAALMEAQGWPVDAIVPHHVPRYDRTAPRSESPLIGFAGRLTPEKGVDWLIEAFAALPAGPPPARLLVVGEGPERPRLEALAARLGIAARVSFAGHRSRGETQRLLEPAWAQAVPSLWPEPFGLVAAEALMRATPAIVSDAGAPSEIVRDGQDGIVVPTGDRAALTAALARIAGDRGLVDRLGAAARARAEAAYHDGPWIERYLEAHALAIERAGARGGAQGALDLSRDSG